jgi:toxin ParE1/3/4
LSRYRLSVLAELDLTDIVDYTTDVWGGKQAEVYLDNLVECFIRIAKTPELGRSCGSIHPGFRRMEQGKHVIFYRADDRGVFVSRVLHQSMLPARHELMDD